MVYTKSTVLTAIDRLLVWFKSLNSFVFNKIYNILKNISRNPANIHPFIASLKNTTYNILTFKISVKHIIKLMLGFKTRSIKAKRVVFSQLSCRGRLKMHKREHLR